ncbi:MarR family transcriptional regulator [Clostridium fermenticellae]|uniref:MarR family transcriptional regulator n=1 Tax=Clostridium fermenticellae TaxID=2068654 RepID=A0A386H4J4_9CLOT|nr:MarR family transcriptional regulator [Clostridium fermenticellae]AYD40478.1 MarR family transcriptional regulator [Clostridium fermenticellae]
MNILKEISLLHRKMDMVLNLRIKKYGLSISQYIFLQCIYDTGEMTQIDLCKNLDLDKSTVAKSLARLEKNGLVSKKVNPADIRSVLVSLTPSANALIPEIQKICNKWIDDVTSDMTEIEKDVFLKLICKASNRACKLYEQSTYSSLDFE